MPIETLRLGPEHSLFANRAMGAVLVLYHQLMRDGGITHDQMSCVNVEDFHPFNHLGVVVSDELTGIDASLLREGAVIYLLCALKDLAGEENFQPAQQPLAQRILSALASEQGNCVPEAAEIAAMLAAGADGLRHPDLSLRLAQVYQRHVVERFRVLLAQGL